MTEFNDVEAVILDKDGVFNNFHKVWLRVIAYRAQLIAEHSADTSDVLTKVRTACIRSMGVDEDDETIDPYGPCSMPLASVRLALATALFITKNEIDPNYKWETAFQIVDKSIIEARETVNVVELSESFPGAIEKIKEIAAAGFKIGVFTSDSEENTEASLDKFGISSIVQASQAGKVKTQELYHDLCQRLSVQPSNTVIVTDAPNDLKVAKANNAGTILTLTGIIAPEMNLDFIKSEVDMVIDSLADLNLDSIHGSKKKVTS